MLNLLCLFVLFIAVKTDLNINITHYEEHIYYWTKNLKSGGLHF